MDVGAIQESHPDEGLFAKCEDIDDTLCALPQDASRVNRYD